MKKCASHLARAGESIATFTSRIGLLLTKSLTLLRHIRFSQKHRTHTHGVGFSVDNDRRWKINKNSEKCEKMCIRLGAQGWPGWYRFSILGAFFAFHTHMHPTHRKVSTPHCLSGLGFRQLCKNEQKTEKIWKNVETTRRMQGSRMHPSPAQLDYFAPSHPPFFPSIPTTLDFSKTSHKHTRGCVFLSKSIHAGKSTEIQKNVEKCAFDSAHRDGPRGVDFPFWVPFSFSTPKHPTHSASTPHRVGWHPLDFAKMNKNRKKYGKMCITLGACRGVECNLQQPNWTTSHPATLRSFHPSPPHWVFSKTSHTHTHGVGFSVDIDPCWKINRNSEKCGKMCIRLSALGWPG